MRPLLSSRFEGAVLLAEDEALTLMDIELRLTELGLTVVGSCSSVAAALRVAETEALDAALLDVNLGGKLIYPVANVLKRRSVPFAFMSGYSASQISDRLEHVTNIGKPVADNILVTVLERLLNPRAPAFYNPRHL